MQAEDLVGYSVRIVTLEGHKLEFRVVRVRDDSVAGLTEAVRFDEKRSLERREFGLWETAGFVALVVAAGHGLAGWHIAATW